MTHASTVPARGDNDQWSDLDVFVEVERLTAEVRDLIADAAWEVGLAHLVHISPLVFSRDDVEHSPQRSSPVLENIRRDGVQV